MVGIDGSLATPRHVLPGDIIDVREVSISMSACGFPNENDLNWEIFEDCSWREMLLQLECLHPRPSFPPMWQLGKCMCLGSETKEKFLSISCPGLARGSGDFIDMSFPQLIILIPRGDPHPHGLKWQIHVLGKFAGWDKAGVQKASSIFLLSKVPEAVTQHFRARA